MELISQPTTERIFAIGDIHGHYDELMKLLDKISVEANYDPEVDHLVFCGDLVDVGPDSRKVVEWCMKYKEQYPTTFHPIKGNHDDMMVDSCKYNCAKYDPGLWFTQGGEENLDSYINSEGKFTEENKEVVIPKEHINWLEELPVKWESKEYFFVHGGVPPLSLHDIKKALYDEQKLGLRKMEYTLMWEREKFYGSNFHWEKKIIFAHTGFESRKTGFWEPFVRDTMIGINTMPRNDGKLTCVQLPEEVFFFQSKL